MANTHMTNSREDIPQMAVHVNEHESAPVSGIRVQYRELKGTKSYAYALALELGSMLCIGQARYGR